MIFKQCRDCNKPLTPEETRVNHDVDAHVLYYRCEDCWQPDNLDSISDDGRLNDLPELPTAGLVNNADALAVMVIRAHRNLAELKQYKADIDHWNDTREEPMEYGFNVEGMIVNMESFCAQVDAAWEKRDCA